MRKFLSLLLMVLFSLAGCNSASNQGNISASHNLNNANAPPNDNIELSATLKKLCNTSGGKVSVAVLHVETGNLATADAAHELPLFSVFKLPLAIAVLKDVEEGRLKLDQKVHIDPGELVPGLMQNTQRWRKPVDLTVKQLLELSVTESDNTSSDKLLQLSGGPQSVTERMHSFDLQQINITTTIKDYVATRSNPNTGSALGLVKLLARLQRGELLASANSKFLIEMMERTKIGLHRLRGNLPPGTRVADKTGSGDPDPKTNRASSTNDVGLITLPNNRGHLAVAVLLREATLTDEQQEKLIADLARAAFDVYASLN